MKNKKLASYRDKASGILSTTRYINLLQELSKKIPGDTPDLTIGDHSELIKWSHMEYGQDHRWDLVMDALEEQLGRLDLLPTFLELKKLRKAYNSKKMDYWDEQKKYIMGKILALKERRPVKTSQRRKKR